MSIDFDSSGIRIEGSVDEPQQGCLARAAWTDQGDTFAGADLQGQVTDRNEGSERARDGLESDVDGTCLWTETRVLVSRLLWLASNDRSDRW